VVVDTVAMQYTYTNMAGPDLLLYDRLGKNRNSPLTSFEGNTLYLLLAGAPSIAGPEPWSNINVYWTSRPEMWPSSNKCDFLSIVRSRQDIYQEPAVGAGEQDIEVTASSIGPVDLEITDGNSQENMVIVFSNAPAQDIDPTDHIGLRIAYCPLGPGGAPSNAPNDWVFPEEGIIDSAYCYPRTDADDPNRGRQNQVDLAINPSATGTDVLSGIGCAYVTPSGGVSLAEYQGNGVWDVRIVSPGCGDENTGPRLPRVPWVQLQYGDDGKAYVLFAEKTDRQIDSDASALFKVHLYISPLD
jgi:hypothetical protein